MPAEQPGMLPTPRLMTMEEWNAAGWRVDGPVALRVAPDGWDRAVADIPLSRKRPPRGTVGLVPVRDPIGGVSVFPICVSADPDMICYPSYVRRTPEGVEYGPCRCRRSRPDVPAIDLSGDDPRPACALQWNGRDRPACTNAGCRASGGCRLVRLSLPLAGGAGRPRLSTYVCICSGAEPRA